MKFKKNKQLKWLRKKDISVIRGNYEYRKKHPEFLQFKMPKSFYFKILYDRCTINWAIIQNDNNKFIIYFIDENGRAFDKLEYKNKKVAQRLLRKNKFISSNNQKCPYMPIEPIYVKLNTIGKYSNGKVWIPQERYRKQNNINRKSLNKNNSKEIRDRILNLIMYLLIILLIILINKIF